MRGGGGGRGRGGEAEKPDVLAALVATRFQHSFPGSNPSPLWCKRQLFSTLILYFVSVDSLIYGKQRQRVKAIQFTFSTAAAMS